ncbi:hypothetical protein I4F81_011674 [Pyropia yezoensis]|uniref:Uncharacterized protein n=1 Tax=Pyropia yezoensis TaxID=2788 RepID=A0ACC3CHA6_PYRYE|nr:hypothetical protein I4F81_011674 [Neopyropia yezoensis]
MSSIGPRQLLLAALFLAGQAAEVAHRMLSHPVVTAVGFALPASLTAGVRREAPQSWTGGGGTSDFFSSAVAGVPVNVTRTLTLPLSGLSKQLVHGGQCLLLGGRSSHAGTAALVGVLRCFNV